MEVARPFETSANVYQSIRRKVSKKMCTFIRPSMALQPLPGLGLPQNLPPFILRGFLNMFFMGWGCEPHAQPPTWRTRVSLLVSAITFDLSGMRDPTSSYAAAGLALL